MASYMEKVQQFLDSENPLTEQMGKLEAKAGIKKIHQFYGKHPAEGLDLF